MIAGERGDCLKKKILKKETKLYQNGYETSEYNEIYRQLRTNLEYSSIDNKLQIINVTSTIPAEGKSTVAGNLAKVSMAKYTNTLVIDCDLRKPVIHQMFQISNSKGLSDLLLCFDDFDLYDDVYFQKFKGAKGEGSLYILPSGTKTPNPQELLGGEKFKRLIEMLKERFDFIVIDCPPVLSVADAIPVSNIADGTLFIISSKETNKQDIKLAVTQLKRNGANILGTVLTKVEHEQEEYYHYYDDRKQEKS